MSEQKLLNETLHLLGEKTKRLNEAVDMEKDGTAAVNAISKFNSLIDKNVTDYKRAVSLLAKVANSSELTYRDVSYIFDETEKLIKEVEAEIKRAKRVIKSI